MPKATKKTKKTTTNPRRSKAVTKPSRAAKPRAHTLYHADGSVWAKGFMLADQMHGDWTWFRKDGTRLRSGSLQLGEPVGEWTTYDAKGNVHKVTRRASTRKSPTRKAPTPKSSPKAPAQTTPSLSPSLPPDILAYHAALAPSDRAICDALAAIIVAHLRAPRDNKAATIESKIWHRHPVWFIDANPIVGYHKLKDGVRLLFWSGQSFDEPGLTPEGSFKAAETRFTAAADISATDLKRWLKKAATIQWDYKNIVKRKGRLERLS